MKLYFESHNKRVIKKTRRVRPKKTNLVQPTKNFGKTQGDSKQQEVTTKKPRTTSAPQVVPRTTPRDYRPLSHDVRYFGERKPPITPKIAFGRRIVPKKCVSPDRSSNSVIQGHRNTKNETVTFSKEAIKGTPVPLLKSRTSYKTCFSSLNDKSIISESDEESEKLVIEVEHQTVSEPISEPKSDPSVESEIANAATNKVFESRKTSETTLDRRRPLTGARNSISSVHSESESTSFHKLRDVRAGTRTWSAPTHAHRRLSRQEVIEQGNKSRTINDIISNISVYLPSLQTKIDKLEKDNSRLDGVLSVAKTKIENHVPVPDGENTDTPEKLETSSLQAKIDKINKDYSRLDSILAQARRTVKNHVPTPEGIKTEIIAWA